MKKVLNVLGIIFSFLAAIVIFALEVVLTTNVILNDFVKDDTLEEVIERIVSINNTEGNLLTFADTNSSGNLITYGDKADLKNILNKLKDYLINYGFDEKEALEIVEDKEFKHIVNTYLESVILNEIKDTEIKYPSKEEIKSFVKKNYKTLNKIEVIKEKYTESTIETLVDDNYEEVKEKLDEIKEEVKIPELKEIVYLKTIINISPFIIMGAILIMFSILMLFRQSFYKWLLWSSVPTFLNGIIFSLIGIFGSKILNTIKALSDYSDLIDPIAKKMSTLMMKYGFISIVITVIMLTIYLIINNKKKEKKSTKK